MPSTVLAGAIEFSPFDIALILAVLALFFVAVTAPGWVALAASMGARSRRGGPRVAASVGGALLGMVVSGLAWALGIALVGQFASYAGVLLSAPLGWAGCWGVAVQLRRRRPVDDGNGTTTATGEGWGR